MTTARARAAQRKELLESYIDAGLGDWAAKLRLADERPDLVVGGKHGGQRLQRIITAIRRSRPAAESTPEAVYLASLKRQLRLIESQMERSASPDLASLAHRLTREIALAEGVPASIVGPGGKVKRLNAAPVDAPTTPAPTAKKPDGAGTPPDAAIAPDNETPLARVHRLWPAMAAEMDRAQPAKEGGS